MYRSEFHAFLCGKKVYLEIFGLALALEIVDGFWVYPTEESKLKTLIALLCGGIPSGDGYGGYWFIEEKQMLHFRFLLGDRDEEAERRFRFQSSPWRPVIWKPKIDDRDLDDIPF